MSLLASSSSTSTVVSALPASTGLQCFNYDELPKAFVYGKRTQPGQVCAQGPFELTGAVFKPQGLQALLRIDAADVNDGPVNVDDVIGGGVADQLFNAAGQHPLGAECLDER